LGQRRTSLLCVDTACGSLPFGSLAPRTVNVVVRRDGERMTVLQEPIASLPDELKRIVEDEV